MKDNRMYDISTREILNKYLYFKSKHREWPELHVEAHVKMQNWWNKVQKGEKFRTKGKTLGVVSPDEKPFYKKNYQPWELNPWPAGLGFHYW